MANPTPTFDHLVKRKKPRQVKYFVPFDDTYDKSLEEADNARQRAMLLSDERERDKAQEAYDKALADYLNNGVTMVMQALPRKHYSALKASCPPDPEEADRHRRETGSPLAVDIEAFAVKLIAASCVSPRMTEEQVASLQEEHGWSEAEFSGLFRAAQQANETLRVADLDF